MEKMGDDFLNDLGCLFSATSPTDSSYFSDPAGSPCFGPAACNGNIGSPSDSGTSSVSELSPCQVDVYQEFKITSKFQEHRYRYVSEHEDKKKDKKDKKEGQAHGDYFKASIELPTGFEQSQLLRLELSTVQTNLMEAGVHPTLLRVRIPDYQSSQKNKDTVFATSLDSPNDWRVLLECRSGQWWYVTNKGSEYPINECLIDNNIILGSGYLEMSIIKTLLGTKKSSNNGIKIEDVIRARINHDKLQVDPDRVSAEFGASDKLRSRCRLRLRVFDAYDRLLSTDFSEVVVDKGKVTKLKFDSDPKSCCSKGGFQKVLVANQSETGAKPVFVLKDINGNQVVAESIYPQFNTKLADLKVHSGSYMFTIPDQLESVVKSLGMDARQLRLTLMLSDNTLCEDSFDFKYKEHKENFCPYCIIRTDTNPDAVMFSMTHNPNKRPLQEPGVVVNEDFNTIDDNELHSMLLNSSPFEQPAEVPSFSLLSEDDISDLLEPQPADCSPEKRVCTALFEPRFTRTETDDKEFDDGIGKLEEKMKELRFSSPKVTDPEESNDDMERVEEKMKALAFPSPKLTEELTSAIQKMGYYKVKKYEKSITISFQSPQSPLKVVAKSKDGARVEVEATGIDIENVEEVITETNKGQDKEEDEQRDYRDDGTQEEEGQSSNTAPRSTSVFRKVNKWFKKRTNK